MTAPHTSLAPAEAAAGAPPTARSKRLPAIDLTKGALVVLMVVYHSTNYFCHDKDALRYLHFLPASFIFIAGFLVTQVQHPKLGRGEPHVRRRLLARGAKLLIIFLGLNVVSHAFFTSSYNHRDFGIGVFAANVGDILLYGGQRSAVFDVLLPISYVLMLASAMLVRSTTANRWVLGTAATALVAISVVLAHQQLLEFNLELVSMGVFGMAIGLVPLDRIRAAAGFPLLLLGANAIYAAVTSVWFPFYEMNIAGVCLALLLLLSIGVHTSPDRAAYRWLVLLGRYTLIGYIAQIAVLQALYRAARHAGWTDNLFPAAVVVTTLVITAMVAVLDRLCSRSPATKASYQFLFA